MLLLLLKCSMHSCGVILVIFADLRPVAPVILAYNLSISRAAQGYRNNHTPYSQLTSASLTQSISRVG